MHAGVLTCWSFHMRACCQLASMPWILSLLSIKAMVPLLTQSYTQFPALSLSCCAGSMMSPGLAVYIHALTDIIFIDVHHASTKLTFLCSCCWLVVMTNQKHTPQHAMHTQP